MGTRLITIATALFMTMSLMAQDENAVLNVTVGDINYTAKKSDKTSTSEVLEILTNALAEQTISEEPGYADAVRSSVITALGHVRRFMVSDGHQVSSTPDTQLLIDGIINYITTVTEWSSTSDKRSRKLEHHAKIGVTLHTKDAATGKVLDSELFEVERSGSGAYLQENTKENALKNALQTMRLRMIHYYNNQYPYTAHILERGTEKKDKQKEVYLDMGAAHGVREGTHFAVYVIGSIGGKETRKQIGKLKVSEVEGDEVSRCKVTSGGKDIKAALDAQQRLLIISID